MGLRAPFRRRSTSASAEPDSSATISEPDAPPESGASSQQLVAASSPTTPQAHKRPRRILGVVGRLVLRLVRLLVYGVLFGVIGVGTAILIYPTANAYVHPQTYVYGDSQTAAFITWSEHDGAMDGSLQLASVDATAQVIRIQTSGFTGTHDGSHVSITFHDLPLGIPTVSGELGWRSLQLGLPQSSGMLVAVRLKAGDLNDYNQAVQAVKNAHPGLEIQGN